jgi:hypothetical protein
VQFIDPYYQLGFTHCIHKNPFNFADIIYKLWVEKSGAAVPAVGFKKFLLSRNSRNLLGPTWSLAKRYPRFFSGG